MQQSSSSYLPKHSARDTSASAATPSSVEFSEFPLQAGGGAGREGAGRDGRAVWRVEAGRAGGQDSGCRPLLCYPARLAALGSGAVARARQPGINTLFCWDHMSGTVASSGRTAQADQSETVTGRPAQSVTSDQ